MTELVRAGRSPEMLAKELEPTAQTIRNWITQADRDEGRPKDGLSSLEREELRRLRRDNRRLREQRIGQVLLERETGPGGCRGLRGRSCRRSGARERGALADH